MELHISLNGTTVGLQNVSCYTNTSGYSHVGYIDNNNNNNNNSDNNEFGYSDSSKRHYYDVNSLINSSSSSSAASAFLGHVICCLNASVRLTATANHCTSLHGLVIFPNNDNIHNDNIHNNNNVDDDDYSPEDDYPGLSPRPIHMIVLLSIMYAVTFLSALLGNAAIVSMVIKDRRFHSATYILIMNLAIADLIMTIVCHPINLIITIYKRWLFGAFMCKAVPFLQGVAVCASVNTLVVIAVDRYVAICHVMRPRNTKCITRIILIIIWIVAIALMTPWALYYKLARAGSSTARFDVCYEHFPEEEQQRAYFLGVIFLTCYALPLLFIVVCYVLIGYRVWHRDAPGITSSKGVIEKSKIRVVKMLVVVVLLFTFSWLPLYIFQLKALFGPPPREDMITITNYLVPFAQWLGTSNSCMNPLVYCLFSQKIRRRIKAMICCTKQELRTLYSNKSVYSSVVQNNRRDSGMRRDSSMMNGNVIGGYSQHQHHSAGSMYDHRNHVKAVGRCDQNELLTFHTRNGVKSTHV